MTARLLLKCLAIVFVAVIAGFAGIYSGYIVPLEAVILVCLVLIAILAYVEFRIVKKSWERNA
jgi:hypothetical protein